MDEWADEKAPPNAKAFDNPKPQHCIDNLPPEILGHIFACLQTHTNARWSSTGPASNNPSELLRVTQVCQYWRQVALCTPYLWTHIQVRGPKDPLAIASFFRSGDLPLHVDFVYEDEGTECPDEPSRNPGTFKLLRANLQRVESLSLHTDSLDWAELELGSAKALRALHVSTSDPCQNLPINLFSDSFPLIEELVLSNYSPLPPCNSLQLYNLRKLSLHNSKNHSGENLHFCEYLPLISASPQLEYLLISRAGSSSPLEPSSGDLGFLGGTPTPLPHLRSLTLRSTTPKIDDIFHFLSCIQIPNTASRYLFTSSWSEWPGESLTSFINQARFVGDPTPTDDKVPHPIHKLEIISSKSVDSQKAFGLEDGTVAFTANLSWAVRSALLSSGMLSEVEELVCVDLPGYYSTAELLPLFTALPSLRELTVSENVPCSAIIARACDVLRPQPIGLDRCEQRCTLPCPLLESICLGCDNPLPEDGRSDTDLSTLALLAEERAQRGSPLRHVFIENCGEQAVVRLRQHVESVETSQECSTQGGRLRESRLILKDVFGRTQPPV